MTLTLPPVTRGLVAPHGGMDEVWYRNLVNALKDIDGANGNIADLGTAAAEDIGTSGEKVPMLNAWNVFSKAQTFDVVTLTDAASIAWDWSLGPIAKVTLTDNRALAAPTNQNGKAGTWALFIYQDAVGGRTLSYDNSYLFTSGNDPVLSASASAVDVLVCVSDGTSKACSLTKNFA